MSIIKFKTTKGEVKGKGGSTLSLSISYVKSRNTKTVDGRLTLWSELATDLLKTKRTRETLEEYLQADRNEQTRIKDVGGFIGASFRNGIRKKENIESLQVLTIDIDSGIISDVWGVFLLFEVVGLMYTTHSHTAEKNRFRLVIPLKRPVTPHEYESIAAEFVGWLGIDRTDKYDKTTTQPGRIMFFPSTSKDGLFESNYADGEVLDPDEVLADIGETNREVLPAPKPETIIEPGEKPGIVGAFCRTYNIHEAIETFLTDVYAPCREMGKNRYTYINGTSAGGLYVYSDGVFAYSHHGTDPANTGRAINAFDLVRIHKYGDMDKGVRAGTPPGKLPSFKDMSAFSRDLPDVYKEYVKEQREKAAAEYDEISENNTEENPDVLTNLLQQINFVDFRKEGKVPIDIKITRKTYVLVAIDIINKTAVKNNWGLCTKNGFIYVFNGNYWESTDEGDFKTFLAKAAIKMSVPVMEARYYQFKDELYKQFLSESNLPTPKEHPNTLINLMNGTFEISPEKQILRKPERADFIKYQLPFEYNKEAKSPIFNKYLKQVLPDIECQKVLAEYIGYIFTRGVKLEKALMLYGSGANGKSVFFEIITALLGQDNVCSYSLEVLTKLEGYQRAELSNKLLNYCSEINGKMDNAFFKQLVSGEPVEACKKYKDPFIMTNYAKLLFNCNILPTNVEQTTAYFRRYLVIPFSVEIPEKEQDTELAKKIISNELSGVFNWALDGLKRLLNQGGFTRCTAVEEQINKFRHESDSVAMFIEDEGYIPDIIKYIPLQEIRREYTGYCAENGYMPVKQNNLRKRLERLGFHADRNDRGAIIYAKIKCV